MQIKRNELFESSIVWQEIKKIEFKKELYSDKCENSLERWQKFLYAIVKNSKKIEEEKEILKEILVKTKEYKEYEKELNNLISKNIDSKGRIINGEYPIKEENLEKYLEEKSILDKKYQEDIKKWEDQIESYNKLLKEKIDFNTYKLDYDNIPLALNGKQLESILILTETE